MLPSGPSRRVGGFVQRRLTSGEAWGLGLTVGVGLVATLGLMFALVTAGVVAHDGLSRIDPDVTAWLVAHRNPTATALAQVATWLGHGMVTVPAAVAAAVLLSRAGQRVSAVLAAVITAAGAALLVGAVKLLVARPRPELDDMLTEASGFAFPSGHSAQAMACYGLIAWLACRRVRGPGGRAAILLLTAALIASIGWSRLYLAAHWTNDVAGGFTVAALWLTVVLTTLQIWWLRAGERP